MEELLTTPASEPFPYYQYLHDKKTSEKRVGIGIMAHELIPLEIIRAFKRALVIPLVFVGPENFSNDGGSILTSSTCTFARNVVGGFMADDGPRTYKDVDLFIRSSYCNGDFCGLEYLAREMHVPRIDFNIPMKSGPNSISFFAEEILLLRENLEKALGDSIIDDDIELQIAIHEKLRHALAGLPDLGIHGPELLARYQEAAVLEPVDMIQRLDWLYPEQASPVPPPGTGSPRMLLTGDSIFVNDFFENWLDEFGADIVYYDTWIGGQMGDLHVETANGDLVTGIARSYLVNQGISRQVPASFDRRIERLRNLISQYAIGAVINHTLKFCDFQAIGRPEFKEALGQDVPVLDIERDYSRSGLGNTKTRVEAFIEMLKEG
jgi:benzoyl-CoA reductase/2-hydroxyglutaryl-CoA dehydratase subunit BcrC/BadD/HgdB